MKKTICAVMIVLMLCILCFPAYAEDKNLNPDDYYSVKLPSDYSLKSQSQGTTKYNKKQSVQIWGNKKGDIMVGAMVLQFDMKININTASQKDVDTFAKSLLSDLSGDESAKYQASILKINGKKCIKCHYYNVTSNGVSNGIVTDIYVYSYKKCACMLQIASTDENRLQSIEVNKIVQSFKIKESFVQRYSALLIIVLIALWVFLFIFISHCKKSRKLKEERNEFFREQMENFDIKEGVVSPDDFFSDDIKEKDSEEKASDEQKDEAEEKEDIKESQDTEEKEETAQN